MSRNVPRITVVLKFGGTSVADPRSRDTAVKRVSMAIERGYAPVVVVSAMGRDRAPYATDALLALAHGEKADRNSDLLLACGEIISAATFASLLNHYGIDAVALTGAQAGIITDSQFGDASILRVEPHAIRDFVDRGVVPIVAGFQGVTNEGVTTTLGRGGSDMTAIAIGHALAAECIDIYTDVSGVMTADPRKVAKARTIDRLTHAEMSELADRGAKVMHNKAALYARRTHTPYTIRGLHSGAGTIVDDVRERLAGITGIAMQSGRSWVRLKHGELSVFKHLAEKNIAADLVTIDRSSLSFVIEDAAIPALHQVLDREQSLAYIRKNCSEISIVGEGLRHVPDLMATIVDALSHADIELIHCAGGNLCVSTLVAAGAGETAMRVMHEAFHLDREPLGLMNYA